MIATDKKTNVVLFLAVVAGWFLLSEGVALAVAKAAAAAGSSWARQNAACLSIGTMGLLNIAFMVCYLKSNALLRLKVGGLKENAGRALVLFVGVSAFTTFLVPVGRMLHLSESTLQGNLPPSPFVVITLAVIAPVSEELVFRGALFGMLRSCQGFFPAALLSSLLFALPHQGEISMVNAVGVGLFLCLAYEKTQSLLPPMAIHIANNVFALLKGKDAAPDADPGSGGFPLLALVALCLSVGVFLLVYKAGPPGSDLSGPEIPGETSGATGADE